MPRMKTRLPWPTIFRIRALPLLALLLAPCSVWFSSATPAGAAETYGVIEIGSRGVRGYAYDLDNARRGECEADEKQFILCLNLRSTQPRNVSPGQSDDIKKTIGAIGDTANDLQEFGVPPANLYIVGSSGAAKGEMRDLLALEIQNGLKPINGVSFVTADDEAAYGFEGVLNLIPRPYREQRRRQVVYIDIGGGNTKGAYLDMGSGNPKVATFSLSWGTNSATEDIQKSRGDRDFPTAATAWRKEELVPRLRKAVQNRQGLTNRDRFYLVGGVAWALTTLTNPEGTLKFPPIRQQDAERLYRNASAPDGSVRLCTGNRHRMPGSAVEQVCEVFSMSNLVAGTQIVTGLFQELDMGANGKHVFFIRNYQSVWPLGYLRSRLNAQSR